MYAVCVHSELVMKVKQSLYRSGHAGSVPGGGSCQILRKLVINVLGLPALDTGHSYPQEIFLVLIYVRG